MLVVVLLSAAPTGGAPRTQLIGSAFDPATLSVALSPKQPKAKAALQAAGDRLPDERHGPPAALAVVAVALPVNFLPADDALRAEPPAFAVHARALVRAHGPRAPPTA